MKLLKAHINNFGTLENKDIEFNDLTSFYKENGKGKSTFAAFIKAMFYGLPKDSKFENERSHFLPWNKGTCGGNIEFLYKNKMYRIERTFGKKPTNDECVIYINGVKEELNPKEIGEQIFNIDRNTFTRTLFFDSNDLNFKDSSSNLSSKIYGHVVEFDDTTFNNAISKLDKLEKEYTESNRGSNKISGLKKANRELTATFNDYKEIEENFGQKSKKIDLLNTRKQEIKDKLKEISDERELKVKYDKLSIYTEELNKNEQILTSLNEKYKKIPNDNEISETESANNNLKFYKSKAEDEFPNENEFKRLDYEFSNGIPDKKSIDDIKLKIKQLNDTDDEIKYLSNKTNSNDEMLLNRFSSMSKLEKEEMDVLIKNFKNESINQNTSQKSLNYKFFGIIFALFAVISLILGITLCFILPSKIIGTLVSVIGFILFGGISTYFFIIKFKNQDSKVEKDKLDELLEKYGYSNNDKNILIALFEKDYASYSKVIKEKEDNKNKLLNLNNKKTELEEQIYYFFKLFNIFNENNDYKINKLEDDIRNYQKIKAERERFNITKKEFNEKYQSCKKIVDDFILKYNVFGNLIDYLKEIQDVLYRKRSLESSIKNFKTNVNDYIKQNNLVSNPIFHNFDSNEEVMLNNENDRIIREIRDLEINIQEDKYKIDKLDSLSEEIGSNKELIKEYEHKGKLFKKTKELLQECDKDLKNEFLSPLTNSFKKYSKLIESDMNKNISLNSNYELQYENNGSLHDAQFLSDGMKTIIALCLRLSLIDNMFKDDKPFIILDDPLLTLDEKHLKESKKLVEDLSKELQIVYFTCHESRKI